jgi:HEAT repeat protein
MARRRLIRLTIFAAAVGLVFIVPTSRYMVLGYLRDEPFCEGRPVGYWIHALRTPGELADGPAAPLLASGMTGLPILKEALKSDDAETRARAAQAVARLGPAVIPDLLEFAGRGDERLCDGAAAAVRAVGPDALIGFCRQFADGSPGCWRAQIILRRMATQDRSVVEDLAELLKGPTASARLGAVRALGKLEGKAWFVQPQLLDVLYRSDDALAREVVLALRSIDPHGEFVILALPTAIAHLDACGRRRAIELAGTYGTRARELAPAVATALTDADRTVRRTAARALGQLGRCADEAGDALLRATMDPAEEVREETAAALACYPDHAGVVPALCARLSDDSVAVRRAAAHALGQHATAPLCAATDLARNLTHPDRDLRRLASRALVSIARAGGARPVLETLMQGTRDPDLSVCVNCLTALGAAGASAHQALPAVLERLYDEEDEVCEAAARALRSIDPDAAARQAARFEDAHFRSLLGG